MSAAQALAETVSSAALGLKKRALALGNELALARSENEYDLTALRTLMEAVRAASCAAALDIPPPYMPRTDPSNGSPLPLAADVRETIGQLCTILAERMQALADAATVAAEPPPPPPPPADAAEAPHSPTQTPPPPAPATTTNEQLAKLCVIASQLNTVRKLLAPCTTLLTPEAAAAAARSPYGPVLTHVGVLQSTQGEGSSSSSGSTSSGVSQSAQQGATSLPTGDFGGRKSRSNGGPSMAHQMKWKGSLEIIHEFKNVLRSYEEDALVRGDATKRVCAGLVLADGYVAEIGSRGLKAPARPLLIEDVAHFDQPYKSFFFGRDHWNFLGTDHKDGPVVLSVLVKSFAPSTKSASQEGSSSSADTKTPSPPPQAGAASADSGAVPKNTVELLALHWSKNGESKVSVSADVKKRAPGSGGPEKECFGASDALKVLRLAEPRHSAVNYQEVALGELELGLLDIEEKFQTTRYKFGVLYARDDQGAVEDAMYGNKDGCALFDNFLSLLGTRVVLAGWDRFRGGLDVTGGNATGRHGLYTDWRGFEIMFHVSTLLPFTPDNTQQVERKRHLGNDIVIVVFHTGSGALDPSCFKSQFNHVFVVVRPTPGSTPDNAHYTVTTIMRGEVPLFKPQLPRDYVFAHDELFREFLLTKLLNAEMASMRTISFSRMQSQARKNLLEDLLKTYAPSS